MTSPLHRLVGAGIIAAAVQLGGCGGVPIDITALEEWRVRTIESLRDTALRIDAEQAEEVRVRLRADLEYFFDELRRIEELLREAKEAAEARINKEKP
jgi:hypothetical protein